MMCGGSDSLWSFLAIRAQVGSTAARIHQTGFVISSEKKTHALKNSHPDATAAGTAGCTIERATCGGGTVVVSGQPSFGASGSTARHAAAAALCVASNELGFLLRLF
jgi:hypothetical protein